MALPLAAVSCADAPEQQHAFAMLKQSLETELATMKKRMSEASTEKSALQTTRAGALFGCAIRHSSLDN